MSLDILKEHIKSEKYSSIYLFYGAEQYLKQHYLNQIKHKTIKFEQFNCTIMEGKSINEQEITNTMETYPMMEDRKILIIKDSGIFKSAKAENKEFWQTALKGVPEYMIIIFYEQEIDKRNGLINTIKKQGLVVEFSYLSQGELSNWIKKIVQTSGKKIEGKVINYLLSRSAPGMSEIRSEIEKAILYSGSRQQITIEDIDAIITPTIESKVFVMIDSMTMKEYDRAFELLSDMKQLNQPVLMIMALVYRQFSIMHKMRALMGSGVKELAKELQIPPFAVNKYRTAIKKYRREDVIKIMELCVETDYQIKSGLIKDWTGLYMLMETIMQPTDGQ